MLYQEETNQERPPTIQNDHLNEGSSAKKRNRAAQVNPFHTDQVCSQEKVKHPSSLRSQVSG